MIGPQAFPKPAHFELLYIVVADVTHADRGRKKNCRPRRTPACYSEKHTGDVDCLESHAKASGWTS